MSKSGPPGPWGEEAVTIMTICIELGMLRSLSSAAPQRLNLQDPEKQEKDESTISLAVVVIILLFLAYLLLLKNNSLIQLLSFLFTLTTTFKVWFFTTNLYY